MSDSMQTAEVTSQAAGAVSPTPAVSIVLVSFNSRKDLEPCIDSIFSAGINAPFEVIIVDNGSQDGTPELVRRRYPLARLIESKTNTGFAGGTNRGVAVSQGDFILLLNNDTLVNGDAINRLVDFMRSTPDAGAAGGKLLNPDGSFQAGYAHFSSLSQELLISLQVGERLWRGYPSHCDSASAKAVDWINAACLLVRRCAFAELGGLDEDYFMYSEEVDFQFRLKHAGWNVYYLPGVHTIHYGGRSQDRWRRRRMVYRGKILFYRKNYRRASELALRMMLASVSAAKLTVWAAARVLGLLPDRAEKEFDSNREVLALCVRPK